MRHALKWCLALVLLVVDLHSYAAQSDPLIKRIALIPAANPKTYFFANAAPPLGYPLQFWVNKADSKSKAKKFNAALTDKPITVGTDLTNEVAAALRERGFTVEILYQIAPPAEDPDDVDYDKITAECDAILHLWITGLGMYSSPLSLHYVPRVDAAARVYVKGRKDFLYDEEILYGVDARKGKEWAILPDPKFSYDTFESVMASIDEVRVAFAVGTDEIGKRMVEQLDRSIRKPAAPDAPKLLK